MSKCVNSKYIEYLAQLYAERNGIIEYSISGTSMVYIVSYPEYLSNPAYTLKITVDLLSGMSYSEKLKKFYKKGLINRH